MDVISTSVILASFILLGAAAIWLILSKAQQSIQIIFENLANKILDQKAEKFDAQTEKQINNMLSPFRRDMENLKNSVDQSSKERFSLKEEIQRIGSQANNLANALKAAPKTRGNWGEILLEKILEDSGLRKNHDYILQGTGLGLKHEETGQPVRPDVIIKLPENKQLIVDSKLSLVHYEAFYAEQKEDQRKELLNQFLKSTRKHADDLAQKHYQGTRGLHAPDFVLMFMPIEGAYLLAMIEDPQLHSYALNKKIVIVSPSTLFATMQTVASLWRLQQQNQNADEIARQGGALYDKIASFIDDMKKLGQQIQTAQNSHDSALRKLSSGRGNIISQTEKLKQLGARTSKQLPSPADDDDK